MTVRLTTPRIRVVWDGDTVFDVQVINPDLLAWETARRQHKWDKPEDSPITWLTFLAWHHLTRTGRELPETVTLKEFSSTALEVTANPNGDDETVDPTNRGLDPE